MRKILCFLAFTGCLQSTVYSQDPPNVKFGKVSAGDFVINSRLVDSNAGAVIIADVGNTTFVGNDKGWFSYVFNRKRRIKLLKQQSFDLGTIAISLYKNGDDVEKITDIVAVTYTLENGKVKETKLEKKNILEEKIDKNHIVKKFAMPALTEGSIIEYSYSIRSDFPFNIPEWEFQHYAYPTLWSEYNAIIPGLLIYMMQTQGYNPFFIDKTDIGREVYKLMQMANEGSRMEQKEPLLVTTQTLIRKWVMKDEAPLGQNVYINTPDNFIDKISFQLNETFDGVNSHPVVNTWFMLTKDLMNRDDFGKPLEERDDLVADVAKSIEKTGTKKQQAKAIYEYVRDNFTCTNRNNKYIKTNLYDVMKKKSGNVGELNLLLVSMLREKDITAYPVLLSTTEFGRNTPNYPMLDKLNYVICNAVIDDVVYYLDASDRYLGFGKLPLNVYNGHARIINKDDSMSAVYFMPDAIKEIKTVQVTLTNVEGGMTGSYSTNPGYYQSGEIRKQLAAGTVDAYTKSIAEKYPKEITLNNVTVDSLKIYESPVLVKYNMQFKTEGEDILYFNPTLNEGLKKNPFLAEQRLYPVEMPYPINESYTLVMDIPKGYRVDELPKSTILKFNDGEGKFEYMVSNQDGKIKITRILKLEKANYNSSDYANMRNFFTGVIKKDNEQIVFKKL